jgi:hypothetical protein
MESSEKVKGREANESRDDILVYKKKKRAVKLWGDSEERR